MGCLRLGFAFIFSLFITAILTFIGAVAGTLIPLAVSAQSINPSSPLASVQANPTGALIGAGIGIMIGLIVMVAILKRALDVNWLKKNGTRIIATVTEIAKRRGSRQVSYYSNGRTQYRTEWYTFYLILAQWIDPYTRQTHIFRSGQLNVYPKRYYPNCGINVLIDPENPSRYLMEV